MLPVVVTADAEQPRQNGPCQSLSKRYREKLHGVLEISVDSRTAVHDAFFQLPGIALACEKLELSYTRYTSLPFEPSR